MFSKGFVSYWISYMFIVDSPRDLRILLWIAARDGISRFTCTGFDASIADHTSLCGVVLVDYWDQDKAAIRRTWPGCVSIVWPYACPSCHASATRAASCQVLVVDWRRELLVRETTCITGRWEYSVWVIVKTCNTRRRDWKVVKWIGIVELLWPVWPGVVGRDLQVSKTTSTSGRHGEGF